MTSEIIILLIISFCSIGLTVCLCIQQFCPSNFLFLIRITNYIVYNNAFENTEIYIRKYIRFYLRTIAILLGNCMVDSMNILLNF